MPTPESHKPPYLGKEDGMRQSNDDGPMIVAQAGPIDGQRWVLHNELLIGRDDDCDIVIPNRQVSRHHARFFADKNEVWVEDLGSRNGTHFNGEPIHEPVMLRDGDIVQIALAQQLIFLSSDATLPLNVTFEFSQSMSSSQADHRLRLEKKSRRMWVMGKEVIPPLSVSQFRLLEILYNNSEQVVPRSDVIQAVWGEENAIAVSDQALDALVRRLRDRLAEFDPLHQYIVTVRGHGIRLENPDT
jgi:hypothetical protein